MILFNLINYFYIANIGTSEIFLDGLPGTPDNLSISPEGNIFVSLVTVRIPGEFNPTEFMYGHPWLRKLILRTLHLIKFPLDLAATYLDNPIPRKLAYYVISNKLINFSICFQCHL